MFGAGHLCGRKMANPQGAPSPDCRRFLALTGLDRAAISNQGDTTDRHPRSMHHGAGICAASREEQGMFKASHQASVACLADAMAHPRARHGRPLPLCPLAHCDGRKWATWLISPPAKTFLQCPASQGAASAAASPLDHECSRRLARRALERHRKNHRTAK